MRATGTVSRPPRTTIEERLVAIEREIGFIRNEMRAAFDEIRQMIALVDQSVQQEARNRATAIEGVKVQIEEMQTEGSRWIARACSC
jgi:hypothetical protein